MPLARRDSQEAAKRHYVLRHSSGACSMKFGFSPEKVFGRASRQPRRHNEARPAILPLRGGPPAPRNAYIRRGIVAAAVVFAGAHAPSVSEADIYLSRPPFYQIHESPGGVSYPVLGTVAQADNVPVGSDSFSYALGIGGSITNTPSEDVSELHLLASCVEASGTTSTTFDGGTAAMLFEYTTDPWIQVQTGEFHFDGYVAPGDTVAVSLTALGGKLYEGPGVGLDDLSLDEGIEYQKTFTTPGAFSIDLSYDGPIEPSYSAAGIGVLLGFDATIDKGSLGGTSWVDPPTGGISVAAAMDPAGFSSVPEPSSICLWGSATLAAFGTARARRRRSSGYRTLR
jgi:hypothetical protein